MPRLHIDDVRAIVRHVDWRRRPDTSFIRLASDYVCSALTGVGWAGIAPPGRYSTLARVSVRWAELGAWDRVRGDDRLARVDWHDVERGRNDWTGTGPWSREKLMTELRDIVGAVVAEERNASELELASALGLGATAEDAIFELGGATLGHDRYMSLMQTARTAERLSIIQAAKHWPIEEVRLKAWVLGGQAREQASIPTMWLNPNGGQEWTCGARAMSTSWSSKGLLVETRETSWYAENLSCVPVDREYLQSMLPRAIQKPMFDDAAPF